MKDQIKQLLKETTPGPWVHFEMDHTKNKEGTYRHIEAGCGYYLPSDGKKGFGISAIISPNDAELIAKAPTYLEWCINHIEQLESRLVELEGMESLVERTEEFYKELAASAEQDKFNYEVMNRE